MAKTVHARTLPVQSLDYKYGKVIVPPYEVDVEFTPLEEAALDSGINANMIPSTAGANNKLADRQYVDDAVSTYSALFLGTSALNLTEEQFLAWANTLDADNNDYCYWWTVDSDSKTIYKRYKYNGTQWLFEYNVADPSSIPTALSQLTDDASHRLVTDTEKATWNSKQSPATTLSGYGITDAKIESGVITLGSNTITPLTEHQDISGKADKSTTVTSVDYNSTSKKITKTINGTTSDVVTLAAVATSGSYNDLSNKPTIPSALSDLSDDTTHRLVTDTEKATWNAKAEVGTSADTKTANTIYGAKAFATDADLVNAYFLQNLAVITALSADPNAGVTTVTTNPEWKIVYTDANDVILFGKRLDNTWYFATDLDTILDTIINGYSTS